jgi:hypothetical protein
VPSPDVPVASVYAVRSCSSASSSERPDSAQQCKPASEGSQHSTVYGTAHSRDATIQLSRERGTGAPAYGRAKHSAGQTNLFHFFILCRRAAHAAATLFAYTCAERNTGLIYWMKCALALVMSFLCQSLPDNGHC